MSHPFRFVIPIVLATLPLAACNDSETLPGEAVLLAPPAPGKGIQLAMTTLIEGGVEAEHCQFMQAPTGEDLWVHRDEVRFTQGSHHVLLYETAYDTIPTEKEDGTPVDTRGVFDCTDGATNGFRITKMVGGSQNGDGDSLLSFPDGVAMRVRAGAVLLMNAHYVNAAADAIEPEVRMNLHTVPDGDVEIEGDILFLYNPLIKVPAASSSRARMRCPVHSDITIANVQSHMHRRGVGYAAMVAGQAPFYENTQWDGVPVKSFEPGLHVPAGASLDYYCDYQSSETQDIYQGPRSTDEMCMLIGSYYPADPRIAGCRDETGESLGGEWVGQGTATCAETLGCLQQAFTAGDGLRSITGCMLATDPVVSAESSAMLRCFLSSDDPAEECAAQVGACLSK